MLTHSAKIRYKARMVTLTFPLDFTPEVLANAIRQENKIKGTNASEGTALPVFVCLYFQSSCGKIIASGSHPFGYTFTKMTGTSCL